MLGEDMPPGPDGQVHSVHSRLHTGFGHLFIPEKLQVLGEKMDLPWIFAGKKFYRG
jgi:hypothetical protein